MKPHPHHEHIKRYAEHAAISETPWKFWQVRHSPESEWGDAVYTPAWHPSREYREKPTPSTTLAGVEFPLPETTAPAQGTRYYFWNNRGVDYHIWYNDHIDRYFLEGGFVHLTKQAAKKHGEAIKAANKQAIASAQE